MMILIKIIVAAIVGYFIFICLAFLGAAILISLWHGNNMKKWPLTRFRWFYANAMIHYKIYWNTWLFYIKSPLVAVTAISATGIFWICMNTIIWTKGMNNEDFICQYLPFSGSEEVHLISAARVFLISTIETMSPSVGWTNEWTA